MIRLLLILLAFAMPLPAAAAPACHRAAASGHEAPHAPRDRDPVTAPHLCFGCAPLAEWLRTPFAAPILPPALPPEARFARVDLSRGARPALPPPRTA